MFCQLDNRIGHYLLLLAVGASLFLINLGGPALWDLDEGRNATAAMEMRESGNWVVPRFGGELRAHKPALLYWLQVLAFNAFGINEFAARLPSALAGIATLLLVYELGRRLFTAHVGLLGGLVLSSTALFCAAAHFANPDALLVVFTTAAMLFFWLGVERTRWLWFAAAGAASGLAMLAKGPVGIVLPGSAALLFIVWSRRWKLLIHPVWLAATFSCVLVALPWYMLVSYHTRRQFITEFFLRHNLDRALNPMEGHSGPPWYYLGVLIVGLMPWSAFLASAAWHGGKGLRKLGTPMEFQVARADATRFLCCWIAVYLAAFTIAATKLPNYILPAFPPCALVIADFLERWRRGEVQVPSWVQAISLTVLGLMGVAVSVGLLVAGGFLGLELDVQRTLPSLGRFWAAFGLILVVGAVAGSWCLRTQRRTAFVVVMACASIAFLAAAGAGACTALDDLRAPRPLVNQAGALQRQSEIRIACFRLEHLPSLNFYVQRDVRHHQGEGEIVEFLRQDLEVFLFLPRLEWERMAPALTTPCRVLATHRDMYRGSDVVVVTNR